MAEASKSYADLVRLATSSGKEYDLALIEKGYKFAFDAHKDQVRQSGEPYIIHPIAVACKLIEFGMDTPSVVAGLLHDVIEDTAATHFLASGQQSSAKSRSPRARSSRRKTSGKC